MAEISPLRRRMIEDMTVRNLSPATQQSYLSAVSKFSRHFGRSPDRLSLVSVREHSESRESFVIQEWWPDSRRVTDVDIEEPRSVRPQRIAISERSDRR